MAVGKISYNGGSGVKGAGETPYTIHADSEPIKSGNFVEKVIRFEEGSSTANDIVLDTLPTTTSAITKVENNRLLTATVTNTALVLRLYDTTQSTVPTLLDHWTLQTPSVRSVDLLYMSDNRIVFAFAVGSEVNAGMIAIDEDEITLGEISTALTHYVYKVLLCKVNANRFAIFTNAGSSAAPYVSYAINSDLTISNPTAIKTYNSLTPSGWISCDNAEDNKIIIALTDSGFNNNLAVTICLYNAASNTLSMGDLVNIPNTSRLAQTVKTISATQALLVYQVSENMLNARLLTMDPSATSTTITVGGIISLKSTSAEFKSMSLIEYEPNKYMLIYDGFTNVVNITPDNVSLGTDTTISVTGENVDSAVAVENRVSIIYQDKNKYPNLTQISVNNGSITHVVPIYIPHTEIIKAASKIDGVAKKGGVAGDEIMVYTLGGAE